MFASFMSFTLLLATATVPVPAADGPTLCPLSGLPGDPALAHRNPLAVMVENTWAARPQSGLNAAEVVFEVHVEGGVTRYMGLFGCTDANIIGPVRSTRQVFASWAHSIRAFLGHCWAKPSGYDMLSKLGVRNIDGVRPRGVATPFKRVESRKKPHNLFTSTPELRRYAAERGYAEVPLGAPLLTFKDPSPAATATDRWIGLNYNGVTYFSHFEFDAATNRYHRFLAGVPHEMGDEPIAKPKQEVLNGAAHTAESASPITVDNLLVLVMSEKVVAAGGVLEVKTIGEGQAILFRDGVHSDGRWVRGREEDRYAFVAADGTPLTFNRGKTWIAVLPSLERLVFAVPKGMEKKIDGPSAAGEP